MGGARKTKPTTAGLSATTPGAEAILVKLSGDWKITGLLPSTSDVEKSFDKAKGIRRMGSDTRDLGGWDSGLLTFSSKSSRRAARPRSRLSRTGCLKGFGN